jgi:hypothetical protein
MGRANKHQSINPDCDHKEAQGEKLEDDKGDWVSRICPRCGRLIIYTITETID